MTRSPPRIRIATDADIAEMHRIRMSVRENRLSDPSSVQPRHVRAFLDAGGRAWVAEIDGHVVGFAAADPRKALVWALFVDPTFEGRGIGRRLHDEMLDWLFGEGIERVRLSTDPGTRAERFYVAAGWSHAGDAPKGEVRYEITAAMWRAADER